MCWNDTWYAREGKVASVVKWERPLWRDRTTLRGSGAIRFAAVAVAENLDRWTRNWQVKWRRRRKSWPTWARTWTATSPGQPPAPLSARSPPSCLPSSFQPSTQSNLLEEVVVSRRMKSPFLEYRYYYSWQSKLQYFIFQVDDGSSSSGGSQSWFARKADEWLPSLTKKQRIIGFMTSLILGMICFGLAVSLLPLLMLNPRKFSLLFSLGSAFTLSSFSFLWGPYNHLVHLLSRERLPFTR